MIQVEKTTTGLSIIVSLSPLPASRPKFTSNANGKGGRAYVAGRYAGFKATMEKILQDYALPPMEGPLGVETLLYCKRARTTKRLWPQGDNDNYEKAAWDALNGTVWVDDDQIVYNQTRKIYSEYPRIEYRIWQEKEDTLREP